MKRSKHDIQPLLAARLRPQRRPPIASGKGNAAPRLRLNRGADTENSIEVDSQRRDCRALLASVQQILGALTAARTSVATISLHLREIAASVRAAERSRRSAGEPHAIQGRIDDLIEAIASVARSAVCDGQPLLDGAWSTSLCETGTQKHRTLNLPTLQPNQLGADSSGFTLASLTTGGDLAIARQDFRKCLAVIERAARAIDRVESDTDSFLAEIVHPLQSALSVALENTTSSITALTDRSLATDVGRLTRSDALLAAGDAARMRRTTNPRGALRLRNGPELREQLE